MRVDACSPGEEAVHRHQRGDRRHRRQQGVEHDARRRSAAAGPPKSPRRCARGCPSSRAREFASARRRAGRGPGSSARLSCSARGSSEARHRAGRRALAAPACSGEASPPAGRAPAAMAKPASAARTVGDGAWRRDGMRIPPKARTNARTPHGFPSTPRLWTGLAALPCPPILGLNTAARGARPCRGRDARRRALFLCR